MPKILETKQQKKYFTTTIVLVIILSLITFWSRGTLNTAKNIPMSNGGMTVAQAEAYLNYLETLKVDPEASKKLFHELITEEELKKEVEAELQVDQPVTPPKIDDRALVINNTSGQSAVEEYFDKAGGAAANFALEVQKYGSGLFSGDVGTAEAVEREAQLSYRKLVSTPVPKEAVAFHKSLLATVDTYKQLAMVSKDYDPYASTQPWPEVYQNYSVLNDQMKVFGEQIQVLIDKYKLADFPITTNIAYEIPQEKNIPFVKTAHALFGVGDTTIILTDIQALIRTAVEEGLSAAFSVFLGAMIEKVLTKIENNYLIANFLFYTDALVAGQYTDDYLNKYVGDTFDRQVIKKFIPQFTCGSQPDNLRPVLQAKATQYLGFEPASIDVKSTDYYQQLSKVGNFLSSEQGWKLKYQEIADLAKAEAEKAAERELTSSGLKTARDTVKVNIKLSLNSIQSAAKASFNSIMQLGMTQAKQFISKFIAALTQAMVTKFVFRGVTSGNAGVLLEQSTCVAAAQMQIVIPTDNTVYQDPAAAPKPDDVLRQECQNFSGGCPATNNPNVPGPN